LFLLLKQVEVGNTPARAYQANNNKGANAGVGEPSRLTRSVMSEGAGAV